MSEMIENLKLSEQCHLLESYLGHYRKENTKIVLADIQLVVLEIRKEEENDEDLLVNFVNLFEKCVLVSREELSLASHLLLHPRSNLDVNIMNEVNDIAAEFRTPISGIQCNFQHVSKLQNVIKELMLLWRQAEKISFINYRDSVVLSDTLFLLQIIAPKTTQKLIKS